MNSARASGAMELSVEDGSSSLDSTAGTAVHYERMLSQVHELQEDLTKTLSVAQRLRSENSALREKYDEVCRQCKIRTLPLLHAYPNAGC